MEFVSQLHSRAMPHVQDNLQRVWAQSVHVPVRMLGEPARPRHRTDPMNDAPERIWLQLGAGDHGSHTWCDQNQGWDDDGPNEPEYVRADLHQAAIDAAVLAERERCAAWVLASDHLWPGDARMLADEIRKGPTP